ncbi:hypothetical protein PM022_19260, partial [Halorubrum ezzemoulense]|uniref:hypothetical protein n=1 Tax=Halorubrum ezzemoulense TaxID=337243 RepID=UPI00232FF181
MQLLYELLDELGRRLYGPEASKPISELDQFIVLFSVYVSAMFWITIEYPQYFPIMKFMGVTSDPNYDYILYAPFLLCISNVVVLGYISRSKKLFSYGIPGLRLRSLSVCVLYLLVMLVALVGYFPWIEVCDEILLLLEYGCPLPQKDGRTELFELFWYMGGQAVLAGLIYETYSHPIDPENIDNERAYNHNQDHWWKLAQVLFTVFAILVAVLTLGDWNADPTDLRGEVLTIFGVLAIFYYVYWKRNIV